MQSGVSGLRGCWFSRRVRRICVRFPIVVASPPATQHWHSIDSSFARGDNRNRPRLFAYGSRWHRRCRTCLLKPRSRPIVARPNAWRFACESRSNEGGRRRQSGLERNLCGVCDCCNPTTHYGTNGGKTWDFSCRFVSGFRPALLPHSRCSVWSREALTSH